MEGLSEWKCDVSESRKESDGRGRCVMSSKEDESREDPAGIPREHPSRRPASRIRMRRTRAPPRSFRLHIVNICKEFRLIYNGGFHLHFWNAASA